MTEKERAKTSLERMQAARQRRKDQGLVQVQLWTRPKHKQAIKDCVNKLNGEVLNK